jgi:hypothetical protein
MVDEERAHKLFIDALDRYVEQRIRPGSFLTAVLENDLQRAVANADQNALALLPYIVRYVFNSLPLSCCGSPDIVKAWLEGREG